MIPENDEERKKYRPADYLLNYFPGAFLAKSKHSYESNIKHCGEEGMQWASEKSVGDGNQIIRHLMDGMEASDNDDIRTAEYHLTCLAWRADELLERLLNKMPPFEHLKSVGMYAIDIEDKPWSNSPIHDVIETNQTLANPFGEWLTGEGLVERGGTIYDPDTGRSLSPEDEEQLRKEYNEYLEANKTNEPAEDDEVLCFDDWWHSEGYRVGSSVGPFRWKRGLGKRWFYESDLQELYQEYLAERKNAKNGTEADK